MLDSYTAKSGPLLSDPRSCGEDLDANLRLMFDLAPTHCGHCKSYHLRHAVRRVVMGSNGLNEDKSKLIDLVRQLILQISDGRAEEIHVVIAGSADTGVLAICAHAALTLGIDVSSRVRFTVIDICESPLRLCRAFAAQHDLSLETVRADLSQPGIGVMADLVVLHSILSYLPSGRHLESLKLMKSWLQPAAAMLISNRLGSESSAKLERRKRLAELFIQQHLSDQLRSSMPLNELSDLLSQSDIAVHEFRDAAEIKSLIDKAGLLISAEVVIARPGQPDPEVGAIRKAAKCSHVVVAKRAQH